MWGQIQRVVNLSTVLSRCICLPVSICFLLVSQPLSAAAPLQVRIAGVSNTQAILTYGPPDRQPCTVEVSESKTFQPLVHDVDPKLFEGGSDERSGSLNGPSQRVFVAGKRKAQKASDGHWYSRALQANQDHYYRVRCGNSVAAGSFRTANIPLGNSYNEMFPPDPSVSEYTPAGAYAWPEFTSWVDASESVIDPQTGLFIKRVTMPLDFPTDWLGNEAFQTVIDVDGKWQNPVAAAVDDGAAAVFSGAGNNWLFLRDDNLSLSSSTTGSMLNLGRTINSAQVNLKAWCTGPCGPEDRKVELCLTVNGVSCAGAVREQALGTTPLQSNSQPMVIGDTTPMLSFWAAAGTPPPDRSQFAVRGGTVDVTGTQVRWRSGMYFNVSWVAGSRITLAGKEYIVASVQGPQLLTLTSSAGTAVNITYSARNAGVLLRKKTASADTISVQFVGWHLGISSLPEGWPASGSDEICQSVATPDASGERGYRCVLSDDIPVVYWINRTTGAAKFLGAFASDYRAGVDGWGTMYCGGGFSLAKPDTFYCLGADNSTPARQILLSCQAPGNEPANWKVTCTNLTPASQGSDVQSLMSAFVQRNFNPPPSLSVNKFGCGLTGIQNERILLGCTESGQDSLGWLAVIDPAKAAPTCSAASNCVIAAQNTWAVAPARWCSMHTAFYMGTTDMYWVAGRFLQDSGRPGDGLYQAAITSGGMQAGGFDICPQNGIDPAIAGHSACSTITVDGEPRDTSPHGSETGAPGELQNAQPGDIFSVDGEMMEILVKSGNAWTVKRGYSPITPPAAHAAGSMVNAECMARRFDRDTSNWSWSWDYLHDPTGANTANTVQREYDFGHPAGRGPVVVGVVPWQDCGVGCYGVRTSGVAGAGPDAMANAYAGFAGAPAGANGNYSNEHPSYSQVNGPDWEKQWLLDGRPFSPGPAYSGTFTPVSGTLYKLSTQTSDGDNLSGSTQLSRLKMPTFAACGPQPLRDASSAATGDVFGNGPADWYKYCVSRGKDECRGGAAAGDIWVNCPNVTQPSCQGNNDQGNVTMGICVGSPNMYLSSIGQIGFGANDPKGNLGRKLTMGLGRHLLYDDYWNARAFADASWMLFRTIWLSGLRTEAMLAKLPPYPQPDGIDRTDFVPLQINAITRGMQGVDNAILQFGYEENGQATDFFCTSRHEACVKGSQDGNGYGLASDALPGVACQNGCTLNLPGISGRVAYYRVIYRDGGNNVIAATPISAAIVP
jgi:hypothetical protein